MQHTDALLRALLHVLTNSPQADAVARALALGTLRDLAPNYVTVHAIVDGTLELRSQFGLTPERERLSARIPGDAPTPEAAVARTGGCHRLAGTHLGDAFPMMTHHDLELSGELSCLALLHEAHAIGVLTVRATALERQDWDMRDLLDGTCSALTLWLLTDARTAPAPARGAKLRITERQLQVLAGLRRELTNGAIASDLGFAVGTIKADITAMSALLGAMGREDLLRKASRAGF